MSFVTALYPVYGGSEDDPLPTYPDLSSLKNQATFVLNNGKIIDLLQVSIVDKENKLKLFSDVQKYLCNSQKLLYLQNIEFNVSPILYLEAKYLSNIVLSILTATVLLIS